MLEDAIRRLRVLIFARVVVITLLLGSFYTLQIADAKLLSPVVFSSFIVALYFLTIIYVLTLRWLRSTSSIVVFAYIQIVIDVITETLLVYLTGGIESWFSFTFLLSIISASIVLNRSASYRTASFCSVLYGLLIEFQFYYQLPLYSGMYSAIEFLYNVFAHIIAFYLVAFLSGHLSKRLSDVTEDLKKKDTYIDNLKTLSKDIIESMPSGVFTTDMDGKIAIFNSSAEMITGISRKDAIGKRSQDIFPFLNELKEPFGRIEGEIEEHNKTLYIGMRFSHLKNSEGTPVGLIGIFRDLTEIKAMEAEIQKKEKWAFIGELSALIAHELRNPLAALKASIEMLYEKKTSEQHGEQLMQIALSEMDRLNGIVTDFLLYAKPQQKRENLFDLHESLEELVTLLQSSVKDKLNIVISKEFTGELFMRGDPKQLKQVFWNLGLNAVDAVTDGGEITISTRKKGGFVEILFKNSVGVISSKDMGKIFFPFFTTKAKGTGLGLAIAQKIAEEHRGKIKVKSHADTGTVFRVILPLNKME